MQHRFSDYFSLDVHKLIGMVQTHRMQEYSVTWHHCSWWLSYDVLLPVACRYAASSSCRCTHNQCCRTCLSHCLTAMATQRPTSGSLHWSFIIFTSISTTATADVAVIATVGFCLTVLSSVGQAASARDLHRENLWVGRVNLESVSYSVDAVLDTVKEWLILEHL